MFSPRLRPALRVFLPVGAFLSISLLLLQLRLSHDDCQLSQGGKSTADSEQSDILVVNPHPYEVLLRPLICSAASHSAVKVVFFIHSSAENAARRQVVRDGLAGSKAGKSANFTIIFVLGSHRGKPSKKVRLESAQHGDILQSSFEETYRNLAIKSVSMMKLLGTEDCLSLSTDWIVKTDDDVFFHPFRLIQLLTEMEDENKLTQRTILGAVNDDMEVLRGNGRLGLTKEEYPHKEFSTYCSGAAYIISAPLARPLYLRSLETKLIPIEDFYMTGQVPLHLKDIQYVHIGEHIHMSVSDKALNASEVSQTEVIFAVSIKNGVYKTADMLRLWKDMLKN